MRVATLCYIRDGDKILLLHRTKKKNDPHEGKWIGLGGKIEPGESPEECVIREVYEESGLKIEDPVFKGVCTFVGIYDKENFYVFVFVVDKFSGKLIESNEGDLAWIPRSEFANMNMYEGDRIFMKSLDREGLFLGKFVYDGDKLLNYTLNSYPDSD